MSTDGQAMALNVHITGTSSNPAYDGNMKGSFVEQPRVQALSPAMSPQAFFPSSPTSTDSSTTTGRQVLAYRRGIIALGVVCLLLVIAVILAATLSVKPTQPCEPTATVTVVPDHCDSHACLHGGTCRVEGYSPKCQCIAGYHGEHCEIDKSVHEKDLSRYVLECVSSSRYSVDYTCRYAYDDSDRPGIRHEWVSDGEGVGAWIYLMLETSFLVTRVDILQRCSSLEQNKALRLDFSDGTNQSVDLTCYRMSSNRSVCEGVDWEQFPLEPVRTSTVKLTIAETCTTSMNGIRELKVWGF